MTFKNIKPGLVMMAVFSIWGMSMVIALLLSVVMAPFIPSGMGEQLLDYLEAFSEPDASTTDIENERVELWDDYGGVLTVQYVIQWTLVALATFWVTGRTGRQAESSQQATGYGVMIALGVMLSYGLMCSCAPAMIMGSSSLVLIAGMFLALFIAAGYFGGRSAEPGTAQRFVGTRSNRDDSPYSSGSQMRGPLTGGTPPVVNSGVKPETFYNMGVQAALGGRREEARQHFTRVLQIQPRNVAAWLQMANLADAPDQAWNYVQQARSISPTDPAVLDAVNVIWPQVSSSAAKRGVPHNQPAYPGGEQDDAEIPRVRLPGSALDAAPEGAPDQLASDGDQRDDPPPPPPPPPISEP